MWHEARKQEKKVREVMVNLQRRAERRKEHYERLMGDPMQLLRITGTKAKIHLDPAVAAAGDSKTTMMPWSGNPEILISQYDVRVHLEAIPDYSKLPKLQLSSAEYAEEMKCNYERYRNLVINLFQEVSEEDYLKRINIEEMYPKHSTARNNKEKAGGKAAIGYSYGDNVGGDYNMSDNDSDVESIQEEEVAQLNVDDLATTDVDKLNLCALEFKISAGYFGRMLHEEKSYQSQQQYARQMAAETRHLHGKHAKRERRLFRESKRFSHIQTTPPSYAQRDSPTYEPYDSNERRQSHSRSSTPEMVQSKVEYITEFGATSDNDEGKSKKAATTQSSRSRTSVSSPRSSTHRHRHDSPSHNRSSPSHSYRRRSRSRSHSRERYHRHCRSRSRDSERRRYRSRSSSTGRSGYKSHSRSRTSHHRSHYSNSRSRTRSRSPMHHRSRYHRCHSSSSDSSRSRTPSPVNKRPTKVSTSEKKDSSTKTTTGVKSKLTPQERLQKKLQLQLNKQLKQDKKTQKIKASLKAAEQMEREDDLREQARKWKSRDSEGYYRD